MKDDKTDTIIREARASDSQGLATLLTALANEGLDDIGIVLDTTPVLPDHATALLDLLGNQGITLLIAERNGAPAGLLVLGQPEESAGTHYAGLTVAVAEKYRRRGIGVSLLSRAQREARARGLDELRLTVRSVNDAALGLYEKLGFETIQRGETRLRMRWPNEAGRATPNGEPDM